MVSEDGNRSALAQSPTAAQSAAPSQSPTASSTAIEQVEQGLLDAGLVSLLDLQELAPSKAAQIDRPLAQDLVDRFVAAGAEFVFVGPHTKLTGPRKIVQKLSFHDDHIHVRFFARRGGRTG